MRKRYYQWGKNCRTLNEFRMRGKVDAKTTPKNASVIDPWQCWHCWKVDRLILSSSTDKVSPVTLNNACITKVDHLKIKQKNFSYSFHFICPAISAFPACIVWTLTRSVQSCLVIQANYTEPRFRFARNRGAFRTRLWEAALRQSLDQCTCHASLVLQKNLGNIKRIVAALLADID